MECVGAVGRAAQGDRHEQCQAERTAHLAGGLADKLAALATPPDTVIHGDLFPA